MVEQDDVHSSAEFIAFLEYEALLLVQFVLNISIAQYILYRHPMPMDE